MKKLLLLPVMALGLLMMQGTALAAKVDLCHCPPGHGGTKCFEINISQNAADAHLKNHSYDHLDADSTDGYVCTPDEEAQPASNSSNANGEMSGDDTGSDIGSGTVDGFTVPKATGSNWREQ